VIAGTYYYTDTLYSSHSTCASTDSTTLPIDLPWIVYSLPPAPEDESSSPADILPVAVQDPPPVWFIDFVRLRPQFPRKRPEQLPSTYG
jgi:hypothetical protein